MNSGQLYIIAAPSGAGKTSLVKGLLASLDGVVVSVSHTTRPPRPGEVNGQDYHFVDRASFEHLIADDIFLEYAEVFDHYYGTSRTAVEQRLVQGVDVILEIDWQGAQLVRTKAPDSLGIFILPPSLDTLRRRLQERGQDKRAVIERRLRDAQQDISHYNEYDYLIINDDFETSLTALRAIFIANRHRQSVQAARQKNLLKSLLNDSLIEPID